MAREVVVVPVGGLGNQLFQVAAAEGLAREHDALTALDVGESSAALDRVLGEPLPWASTGALLRCGIAPPAGPVSLGITLAALRRLGLAGRRRIGGADAFRAPTVVPARGPLAITGYVQHPGHFAAGIDRVVERILAARRWPTHEDQPAAEAEDDVTVLHLRRGDYVRLGWALDPDYYGRALDALHPLAAGSARAVALVGDDPMAAEGLAARLERDGWDVRATPSGRAEADPATATLEDFWRLAEAPRLVMSNSTFCWWAAVVGDALRPGRPVAFPERWIGDGGDLLHRPGWTRVPSGTERDG